ncbi:MAG: hypothetical protein HYW25_01850 [Candidatus Aenigmarchaeota archaeon]|nr:hypothetical protein [Candidatus Aenigmarchaeota archaeon]
MLVSHALVLGLTLVFIAGLMVAVNTLRENSSGALLQSQSQALCQQIAAELGSLYHKSSYEGSYLSLKQIEIPDEIAGERYSIVADGKTLIFYNKNNDKISECSAPVDISGSVRGGVVEIVLNTSLQSHAVLKGG